MFVMNHTPFLLKFAEEVSDETPQSERADALRRTETRCTKAGRETTDEDQS